jgi:hypothetical protein
MRATTTSACFPREVCQLTRLRKLNVINNPLEAMPVELLSISDWQGEYCYHLL